MRAEVKVTATLKKKKPYFCGLSGLMDEKSKHTHGRICVCALYDNNVCLNVSDDSLPVDPQGLDREQVYCSVLQPCQDTQSHCASDARFSTPLPLRLPLSLLMSLSFSQLFLPTSLFPYLPIVSLSCSFPFPSIRFPLLFTSSPPAPI